MVNPELLKYINQESAKGHNQESIKNSLVQAGWPVQSVIDAFAQINARAQNPPSVNTTSASLPPLTTPATQSPVTSSPQVSGGTNTTSGGLPPLTTPTTQSTDVSLPPLTASVDATQEKKDNSTLFTILLLFFVPPIGIIFMWIKAKWKLWIKILITLPIIIAIVLVIVLVVTGGLLLSSIPGVETSSDLATNDTTTSGSMETCVISSDCGEEASCVSYQGDRVCTDGNVGDPCFMSSNCKTDICVDVDDESICTEGNIDDPCDFSSDCKSRICFQTDSGTTGSCSEGSVGDQCTSFTDCQSDLECIESTCQSE